MASPTSSGALSSKVSVSLRASLSPIPERSNRSTGNPISVSLDGATYSIGGEVISVADYDSSGRTSFKSTFDQYWDESP